MRHRQAKFYDPFTLALVFGVTPLFDPVCATDHYAAQASRSNIGIFINQKDD
ncbi:MAG TPA: hypothetical protein VI585_10320 [Candidatus Binatia bacterium]